MAYIDDERRRRAGVGLTPEREAWLAAAMEAQAKGLPIPPRPTEMAGGRNPGDSDYVTPVGNERPTANQGQRVLSPAYTDPRSQAIAQTPGMLRPAHSMLDKLFRPGRADTANQMNREYKENALKGQVAESSSRADLALKELELRARKGDTDALAGLEKYYKVEALRRGGGGVTPWGQFAADGSISDGPSGSAKPKGEEGDTPTPPPVANALPGRLTLGEIPAYVQSNIASNNAKKAELNRELEQLNTIGATRTAYRPPSGADAFDDSAIMPESYQKPIDRDWISQRKPKLMAEIADLDAKNKALEEASAPLTSPVTGGSVVSPDMGSATHSTVDR